MKDTSTNVSIKYYDDRYVSISGMSKNYEVYDLMVNKKVFIFFETIKLDKDKIMKEIIEINMGPLTEFISAYNEKWNKFIKNNLKK